MDIERKILKDNESDLHGIFFNQSKIEKCKTDILIPSNKDKKYCESQIEDIVKTRITSGNLIFTGENVSAARNRNIALQKATNKLVIMLDDDITGFFPGWDLCLLLPLIYFRNINIISARLLNEERLLGNMTGNSKDSHSYLAIVNRVPSACIGFKKDDLLFDESYIGSGFEDTDFCMTRKERYPDSFFIINNTCRLIHLNEMKNQMEYLSANRSYYEAKWGPLQK